MIGGINDPTPFKNMDLNIGPPAGGGGDNSVLFINNLYMLPLVFGNLPIFKN